MQITLNSDDLTRYPRLAEVLTEVLSLHQASAEAEEIDDYDELPAPVVRWLDQRAAHNTAEWMRRYAEHVVGELPAKLEVGRSENHTSRMTPYFMVRHEDGGKVVAYVNRNGSVNLLLPENRAADLTHLQERHVRESDDYRVTGMLDSAAAIEDAITATADALQRVALGLAGASGEDAA